MSIKEKKLSGLLRTQGASHFHFIYIRVMISKKVQKNFKYISFREQRKKKKKKNK